MAGVAVLDYGMGNLRSVEKALARVGADPVVTSDHAAIREADAIVLPGVGAFPKAMTAIGALGLDKILVERREARVPILGICLGMQLLFESSTELGGARGLGLLPGPVERLGSEGLKLPQIGWNAVGWSNGSPLSAGLPDPAAFYHVHSYAPRPGRDEDVIGTAEYGAAFASAVGHDRVFGVQFHPEKSGPDGLRLLENFVGLAGT
ncbi:MAG: imidazole glycerol phosphate synthase subunit HisH [Thermoleophilaceae bacterium]|nr:imidazole glycerol phosphate synthase subunit HisH [Thermoleophilaceae bacterium]